MTGSSVEVSVVREKNSIYQSNSLGASKSVNATLAKKCSIIIHGIPHCVSVMKTFMKCHCKWENNDKSIYKHNIMLQV